MPGFEPDRFVNNLGINLEEFTCGICHGIFIKPVVTDCCQQTYCCDCINQWLNHSNTCPNDRRPLTREQLRPMARAFINLLDNLKITCDYKSEGCLSVVKISDLNNHLKECEYRPNTVCKVCQTIRESVSTHNCIESLMIEKNKIVVKNERLRTGLVRQQNDYVKQLDALNDEFKTEMNKIKLNICEINKQINEISLNFEKKLDSLKTDSIKNIASLNDELENVNFIELNSINPRQIILEARQNINNLQFVSYSTACPFPKKDTIIGIIKKTLLNISNDSFDKIANNIENKINFPCRLRVNVFGIENKGQEHVISIATVYIIHIERLEIVIEKNNK